MYQLFTWTGHLGDEDGNITPVPLVFILMSRRTKADYEACFRVVSSLCPALATCPTLIMMFDFEDAEWAAAKDVWPNGKRKGCNFHWKKAVWKACSPETGPMYPLHQ